MQFAVACYDNGDLEIGLVNAEDQCQALKAWAEAHNCIEEEHEEWAEWAACTTYGSAQEILENLDVQIKVMPLGEEVIGQIALAKQIIAEGGGQKS